MDYLILARCFDRVVAVSQEMKQTLVQDFGFEPEKIDVIHNGVTLPRALPCRGRLGGDCFHIGTVGRMVPVKGFDLFLDVAAEMRRRTDRIRFSILGEGPQKGRLIQKAKDLKIEEMIEFVSPIPDPLPYYESLDLYLNTSLHEGIPLSILEAMACGKPVVAPHVGGLPEIISHGQHGLLVHGREPKDFVDACLRILDDEHSSSSMGESASKRITSRFSGASMAESYRQVYLRLCEES
jgi:glycosyltransferase involved in cell wall biosynthesis